jgi:hypothetical protein
MQEISPEYQIRVVQDLNEFQKLESAWNGLLENQKYHIPFLCFDWFRIWLKHFLKGNKLFVLLVYKGDNLSAIAPLIIRNEKFRGVISAKKIELVGNVHSPIRNLIFGEPGKSEMDVLLKIFEFFKNDYIEWDIMELDSIPVEFGSFHTLRNAVDLIGFRNREYFCFNDWVLDDITYSGDEYMKNRPRNLKKELGKRRRRLERKGNLRFEFESNKNNYNYYKQIYYEVRGKSWKHPENDFDFLNDFRKRAFEKGLLRFGLLLFNDAPISCHLRLNCENDVYFLESVYDEEYEEFSPTTILRSELMKYVIDKEKTRTIHTIRGDEPYKKDWTPKRTERKGILVFNRNFKGRFLSFLMTKMLPIVEKNEYILSVKNKLSGYLKKHGEE